MIKPTIGRVVWFQPSKAADHPLLEQPYSASVAYVHGDRLINIGYLDHNGLARNACSVKLLQDDDPIPENGNFAQWMPYQVGQAKKAEDSEKSLNDKAIEQEIQAKGLTAPRITPADIEANIVSEYYFTAGQGVGGAQRAASLSPSYCYEKSLDLLTFCVLVLQNGFTVTGESACASPENFDAELGRKIARQNAIQKVWPLMGYELRTHLAKPVDIEAIAQRAHEANRAYCQSIGDSSQLPWDDAPDWQRQSAITGVRFLIENPDAGPGATHRSWLAEKERDGWVYGLVKNPETKQHPCIVPFEQLPAEQQFKDHLFISIVRAALQ